MRVRIISRSPSHSGASTETENRGDRPWPPEDTADQRQAFSTVIAIPTPNAPRVIALRDLAEIEGVRLVESYFDVAIRPRPPRGVVLFAPCSFNSLNKLAHGIADNLALSVVAEAIGRGTPVIVGPSLNTPLLDHPEARASLRRLPTWGVTIVPPVDDGEGPRLAPSELLIDALRPYVHRG